MLNLSELSLNKQQIGVYKMQRTNNFDFLRLMTAILVVYAHSFPITGNTSKGGILGIDAGQLRVQAFFAISGYLVSRSWISDPHVVRYLSKRALRIFPALAAATVFTILIVGPLSTSLSLSEYFMHPYTHSYIGNVALNIQHFLPGAFENSNNVKGVNGSVWTLPHEMFLYLLLPLLAVIRLDKIAALLYIPLIFFLTYVALNYSVGDLPLVYSASPVQLAEVAPYFLMGSLFATWMRENQFNIYIAFFLIVIMNTIPPGYAKSIFLVFVVSYAWVSFGLGYHRVFQIPKKIGDLSYGIFLYSFPVQQLLVHYGFYPSNAYANFFAATVISAALAFASWWMIEVPFSKLKPRKAKIPRAEPDIYLAA